MYVLIVSLICALLLGAVRQMSYPNLAENILVVFLIFTAIDVGLRAVMNEPSWVVKLLSRKKKKK